MRLLGALLELPSPIKSVFPLPLGVSRDVEGFWLSRTEVWRGANARELGGAKLATR